MMPMVEFAPTLIVVPPHLQRRLYGFLGCFYQPSYSIIDIMQNQSQQKSTACIIAPISSLLGRRHSKVQCSVSELMKLQMSSVVPYMRHSTSRWYCSSFSSKPWEEVSRMVSLRQLLSQWYWSQLNQNSPQGSWQLSLSLFMCTCLCQPSTSTSCPRCCEIRGSRKALSCWHCWKLLIRKWMNWHILICCSQLPDSPRICSSALAIALTLGNSSKSTSHTPSLLSASLSSSPLRKCLSFGGRRSRGRWLAARFSYCSMSSCLSLPFHGKRRVARQQRKTPKAKESPRREYTFLPRDSGDMQSGLPMRYFSSMGRPPESSQANPKSPSLYSPSLRKTLAGLRSRWMMCRAERQRRAVATCEAALGQSTGSWRSSCVCSEPPSQNSVTMQQLWAEQQMSMRETMCGCCTVFRMAASCSSSRLRCGLMPSSCTTFSATSSPRPPSRTPRYTTLLKPRPTTALRWKLKGPMRFLSFEGAGGSGGQSQGLRELSVSRAALLGYQLRAGSSFCMANNKNDQEG